MNDFTQMHIFFFIASVAAVTLAILLAVMISFIIKILNDIRYISGRAREEVDLIADDLSDLHDKVHSGGFKFRYIASLFSNLYKRRKK